MTETTKVSNSFETPFVTTEVGDSSEIEFKDCLAIDPEEDRSIRDKCAFYTPMIQQTGVLQPRKDVEEPANFAKTGEESALWIVIILLVLAVVALVLRFLLKRKNDD